MRILFLCLAALVIWAFANTVGQMRESGQSADRLRALETKLDETKETNAKLQREIERMSDPEYRQERMRKDMHLSKDGETVFDVPRSSP